MDQVGDRIHRGTGLGSGVRQGIADTEAGTYIEKGRVVREAAIDDPTLSLPKIRAAAK